MEPYCIVATTDSSWLCQFSGNLELLPLGRVAEELLLLLLLGRGFLHRGVASQLLHHKEFSFGDVFPGSCVNQMKREQLFLRACVAGKKWAGISQNCKLPRILGRKEATYTGLTDNLSPDWGTRKSVSKQSREISRRGFSDPGHSHCKGPDSSPQKRSRQAEPEIGCQLGGKPDRRK